MASKLSELEAAEQTDSFPDALGAPSGIRPGRNITIYETNFQRESSMVVDGNLSIGELIHMYAKGRAAHSLTFMPYLWIVFRLLLPLLDPFRRFDGPPMRPRNTDSDSLVRNALGGQTLLYPHETDPMPSVR